MNIFYAHTRCKVFARLPSIDAYVILIPTAAAVITPLRYENPVSQATLYLPSPFPRLFLSSLCLFLLRSGSTASG